MSQHMGGGTTASQVPALTWPLPKRVGGWQGKGKRKSCATGLWQGGCGLTRFKQGVRKEVGGGCGHTSSNIIRHTLQTEGIQKGKGSWCRPAQYTGHILQKIKKIRKKKTTRKEEAGLRSHRSGVVDLFGNPEKSA